MSITVYWGCFEEEWLRAKSPNLIYKDFVQDYKNQKNFVSFCPSVKDYMKNIFSINSLYSYDFKIKPLLDDYEVVTNIYDQGFFNDHVIIRSKEDKLFSFMQRFCFFTEEKSLLMSAGIFPFLEDNNITKRCVVIPGSFDIGKWFRRLDFAFYLKKEYDEFKIEENEIYQYIKFHTNEKIIFKQFNMTPIFKKFFDDFECAKENRPLMLRQLKNYYSMVKHKKYIIKEIKNNLLEDNG